MDYRLTAEEGAAKGLILLLAYDHEWFVGRDPDLCNLVIEDPKVSRQHALLTKDEDGIFVENLSHTNPILINDLPLSAPTLLKGGDLLKIGGTLFRFTQEVAKTEQPVGPQEEPAVDLSLRERFLLKVVAGPQVGAEFSLTPHREYIAGSGPDVADIILYDLSVSRRHAKITLLDDNVCTVEDLDSKNGVFINGERIENKATLHLKDLLQLGTSALSLIDREQASQTIVFTKDTPQEEVAAIAASKQAVFWTPAHRILVGALALLTLLAIFAVSFLFQEQEAEVPRQEIEVKLKQLLSPFSEVVYHYNKNTQTLFLVGHVLTAVDKSQLEYDLKAVPFISSLDDTNVVVDQYIWQEMNNLIARNPSWSSVTMNASKPGVFVVTGYLKTRAEGAALQDFLALNFPFMDRLQNRVAIEENLLARINSDLFAAGVDTIGVQLANGSAVLTGFIASDKELTLQELIKTWKELPGIHTIDNFSVPLGPQEAVMDISGKYLVSGASSQGGKQQFVIINGRIVGVGDTLDQMTITAIEPNLILLEKDGLKFKISYNQQ